MAKHRRYSIDPETMVAHNRAIKDHIYVIEVGALDELENYREVVRLIKIAASAKHGSLQKDGILKLIATLGEGLNNE